MDPKRAPEMIKDFVKTVEPLEMMVELMFYRRDETNPFLIVEKRNEGMVCWDEDKGDFVSLENVDQYDFTGTKLKIIYWAGAVFAPSEFHSIQESIPYNQNCLRKSIKELDVLKAWLKWWKL